MAVGVPSGRTAGLGVRADALGHRLAFGQRDGGSVGGVAVERSPAWATAGLATNASRTVRRPRSRRTAPSSQTPSSSAQAARVRVIGGSDPAVVTVARHGRLPPPTPHETVLVVDFGAQYAQLIARRVREASVHSEIVRHRLTAAEFAERAPKAIIFSGGPKSVRVDGAPEIDPAVYDLGIPIFGICYGAQLIAMQLGGEVARFDTGEYGRTDLRRIGGSTSTLLARRHPGEPDGVDEPLRCGGRPATGFRRHRHDRRHAGGRVRARRPPHLRRAVPPRGRAHAVRARPCSSSSCASPGAARTGPWRR